MPDTITSPDTDIIANADAAAEKIASEQRNNPNAAPGSDFKASVDPVRGDELDQVFREFTQNSSTTENADKPSAAESTPKETPPEEKPVAEEKPIEEKPKKGLLDSLLEEKPAGEEKPAEKPATRDPYDDVKLRSDASPKTQESFQNLKNLARQREGELSTKLDETSKQLADLQKQITEMQGKQGEIPEDVKKELEELRGFRATFDTENDPNFRQKFDARIDSNFEAIYQTLEQRGLKKDQIEQLRAMSIDERTDAIDKVLIPKLDSAARRLVEAKLVDNVSAREARQNELQNARANADKVLRERAEQSTQASQQRVQQIASLLKPAIAKLPFFHPKDVPTTATPTQRAEIEAHNEFAASAAEAIQRAILDDSPATRAEAALAVPLALHLRQENARLSSELARVSKELEEIHKASATARTSRTIATSKTVETKPAAPVDSSDAIDSLFAQISGGKATR